MYVCLEIACECKLKRLKSGPKRQTCVLDFGSIGGSGSSEIISVWQAAWVGTRTACGERGSTEIVSVMVEPGELSVWLSDVKFQSLIIHLQSLYALQTGFVSSEQSDHWTISSTQPFVLLPSLLRLASYVVWYKLWVCYKVSKMLSTGTFASHSRYCSEHFSKQCGSFCVMLYCSDKRDNTTSDKATI